MQPLWEKAKDVYDGLLTFEAKEKYLNRKAGEHPDDFKARIRSSEFDNRYKKTIESNAGLLSDFSFSENPPQAIVDAEKDIDCRGNSLHVWSVKRDIEFLRDGGVLLGVDSSKALDERSQREKKDRRPWFIKVDVRDIFAPVVSVIDGKPTLTQVSIRRSQMMPDGEGFKRVDQYWLYRLIDGGVYYEVYEDKGEEELTLVASLEPLIAANGQPFPRLPFEWYGVTDSLDFREGLPIPVFAELCELNLKHFNKGSEIDRAETICNIPTPKRGWPGMIPENPPPFAMGISHCVEYVVGGEVGFLEPEGKTLQISHMRQLDREARMEAEDRRFLGVGEAPKTATQSIIESSQAKMSLRTMAERKESVFQELFKLWELFSNPRYVDGDDVGGIKISESALQAPATSQDRQQYREDLSLGFISRKTYQNVMIRLGIYDESDFEDAPVADGSDRVREQSLGL